MKALILTIVTLLTLTSNAQVRRTILSESKIGPITSKYYKITTESDSGYGIYFGFQNAMYQHIIDIKGTTIEKEDRQILIDNLKKSIVDLDGPDMVTYEGRKYTLVVPDKMDRIFFYGKDRSGYCLLTTDDVKNMITWLENIQ